MAGMDGLALIEERDEVRQALASGIAKRVHKLQEAERRELAVQIVNALAESMKKTE